MMVMKKYIYLLPTLDNPNENAQDHTNTTTHNDGNDKYSYLVPMPDNPNANAHDHTNTTTYNDGDDQYIYLLPMIDNPNANAQDHTNTTTHIMVLNNIFACCLCLIIPIQMLRTIQTPQHTMMVKNKIFTDPYA